MEVKSIDQRNAWFAAGLGAFIAIMQILAIAYGAVTYVDIMYDEKSYYGVTVLFATLGALMAAVVVGPAAGAGILRVRRKAWKDWGIMFGVLTGLGIIPAYVFFLASPFINW